MNKLYLVFFSLFFLPLSTVYAQDALSLSVSPTLFEMSAYPTQEWQSTIRIINPNPYELTVYGNVVNFAPDGESGQGKFVPLVKEESQGQTIAEWVEITSEPIIIAPEQTVEIPFFIKVPEGAPPGGHFAALLIGTKPPAGEGKSQVKTSQIVTTLVFLRVTGDVIESGDIRSFSTLEKFLEKPEATFELRFQNTGNVHVLPQGEIRITNMWGQERGLIPINRSSMFGNVLPDSTRKYDFTWKGEWSMADIGRYKATAALAYGENGRKFATSEITFWVIPWKIVSVVLLILLGFISLFTWATKLYIRKMLSIAGVTPGMGGEQILSARNRRRVSIAAPIEAGMLDLRGQWEKTSTTGERFQTLANFVRSYKTFFGVAILLAIFVGGVYSYVRSASQDERAYDVTIDGLSEEIHISSEEVKYQQLKEEQPEPQSKNKDDGLPKITIVNRSGVSGLAVDLRLKLESEGYEVLEIQNDIGASEKNTVIVYDPMYSEEAQKLSQNLYGALLSAFSGAPADEAPITVYVGQDLENVVQ